MAAEPRATARPHLGRSFGMLWAASTTSALGDGLRRVALPLLAIHLTRDPRQVALVGVASTLPWLVLGLPVGALVDRWDRVRTMWIVDLSRAVVVALLAVVVATGGVTLPALILVAFVLGVGETAAESAAHALVPEVVAPALLERANGRLQAGEVVTGQFAGQAAGGALFAVALAVPFGVDAATFLASAAFLLALGPHRRVLHQSAAPAPARDSPAALLTETWEGLRWLAHHRLLRTLCGVLAVLAGLSGAFWAIAPLYAVEVLGLGSTGFGILLAVSAAGSLAGGLLAERIAEALGTAGSIRLALASTTAALATLAVTRAPAIAAVALIVNGFGVVLWNVVTVSLRQTLIPPHLLGRVGSAYQVVGLGTQPLGAVLAGLLAHAAGLPAVFSVSAALLAVVALASARQLTSGTIAAAREAADRAAAGDNRVR